LVGHEEPSDKADDGQADATLSNDFAHLLPLICVARLCANASSCSAPAAGRTACS
jgi:hypothetical protein